jgi:fatty acid amide hydrolase
MCDHFACLDHFATTLADLPVVNTVIALISVYLTYRIISFVLINMKYKKLVRAFRAERNEQASSFLARYENAVSKDIQHLILSCTATQLLQGFKEGKFTSEQAVITLALRSIHIAIPMHYAGDIDFFGALEIAREKDMERKTAADPSKLPPLHGLPMSVKDHATVKNLRVTAGLASSLTLDRPNFDCNYVAVLRRQGAIPYMSSNVPQGLAAMETDNHVFGKANNPWNQDRAVGGSSGGEAGLIASRCSLIGIGSDAAGSIRIPSAFCGTYGFAPTAKRVSLKRTLNLRKLDFHYFREVGCSYGPMGRSVDDLALICKSTFGEFKDLDLDIVPMKWDETGFKGCSTKKLRIGYTFDNDFCEPCPAIKNAMLETVEKLKAKGHTLIEVKHDFTTKFLKVGLGIMVPYGFGKASQVLLKGEMPKIYFLMQYTLSLFPSFIIKFFAWFCSLLGEHRFAVILKSIGVLNFGEYYDKVLLREWLKDDYGEMWESHKLDALISPVLPFTAIKHGYSELSSSLLGGTLIYNLLGCPAGTVPIRRVQKDEQHYESKVKDVPAFLVRKNTEGSEGLPVALQIAALPYQDEVCLGVMKEIEECFNYHELQKI